LWVLQSISFCECTNK